MLRAEMHQNFTHTHTQRMLLPFHQTVQGERVVAVGDDCEQLVSLLHVFDNMQIVVIKMINLINAHLRGRGVTYHELETTTPLVYNKYGDHNSSV